MRTIAFLFLFFGSQVNAQEQTPRVRMSLAGEWLYRLDTAHIGEGHNWQDSAFQFRLVLPGSLTANKIGTPLKKVTTRYLNPIKQYVGPLWLQKEIELPPSWEKKEISLFLERTKATQVWIDGRFVGSNTSLSAPHMYQLGVLSPGKHRLTIQVNNEPKLFSVGGSHALSDHTQTNWNGIIGQLYLEALPDLRIGLVKLTPDVDHQAVRVKFRLVGKKNKKVPITLKLQAVAYNTAIPHTVSPLRFSIEPSQFDSINEFVFPLGNQAQLWSADNPVLYRLSLSIYNKRRLCDTATASFGLRSFQAAGKQFKINGTVTFLRGKNDGCIFPLTGYPPTDVAEWRRLYRIAKQYGINHYRFHSYTPPEAAFQAADLEGIYIQTELPNWANFSKQDTFQTHYQLQEGKAILDAYANHPSFVMLSLGNELAGDTEIPNQLVRDLRHYDNRPLFAYGTNAFYNDPQPGLTDDFWVTMRTGGETADHRYDIRGSFATTEDVTNGILNDVRPSTRYTYTRAIAAAKLPVIGHEIGQYQIYPDYRELKQYTGLLKPHNLEIFRDRLETAGMGDQANDFFQASGKLAALLYREEIEMALRTPDFAGFQLLDLQDYPGQGTALVGLLNAFMQNKGLISAEAFRQFNNDVVIQLLMDKYVWTTDEVYHANVQLVNYGVNDIRNQNLVWTICDAATNQVWAKGNLAIKLAEKGGIRPLGEIALTLRKMAAPEKLIIHLEIPETTYQINYPIWVYPAQGTPSVPKQVTVANTLNESLMKQLADGANVLLFPQADSLSEKTVKPQFISEFWNWQVFKKGAESAKRPVSAGTLGILTNPRHPLFQSFPTDYYTNWQWWNITKHAHPLILDSTNADYRPLVQVIDNIDRNHKLGLIFEFKVGKGKLLVCMANLPNLAGDPAARQLYQSMLKYMDSDQFDPAEALTVEQLKALL